MFRNRWLIALGAIVTAFVFSVDAHARVGGGAKASVISAGDASRLQTALTISRSSHAL
jgi:hypothetical protein